MADLILARELVDYARSSKQLERLRLIPWINNFAQKTAKGVFNKARAEKALADYLTRDVWDMYAGRGGNVRIDAATKLAFGKMMLAKLMPRIKTTAARMKKVGLNKGRI